VEKSGAKFTLLHFEKAAPQSKQMPTYRKFGQSGHPALKLPSLLFSADAG
jgi:hypothetical protein